MKNAIIIVTLLLCGCGQYSCIDGVIHIKVDDDVWKVSNRYDGEKCVKRESDVREK